MLAGPMMVRAQQAEVRAWDAADFRIWGYIPYWDSTTRINTMAANGMLTHVSDVLYFGAVRPNVAGDLGYGGSTYESNLNLMRGWQSTYGFKLHLSMMATRGGSPDTVWPQIINDPVARANFVSNVKSLMLGGPGTADDIQGFNFDWERPNTVELWGNYTQAAREMRAAFKNPATPATNHWEVSVCDYGSTSGLWDDSPLFDAKVYDQLFIMAYYDSASRYVTWANQKINRTQGQGPDKAFSNDQLAIGVGTWAKGVQGSGLQFLHRLVDVDPDLAYDAQFWSGTINGVTGTWEVESRKQVREKVQLAFDRGMPGMLTWTIWYDAHNQLSLHRVMQHYAMVTRDIPDLDLNGKINTADATALANNMGMVLTNTGKTTPTQFDAYYLNGNWEKGDYNGNGFVNQQDADWLAARFNALGVTLPDRLAYTGTFENFSNSQGLVGRWRAGRNAQNKLIETSNFKQEAANHLSWSGTGAGASQRSNRFVTIRNRNTAETAAGINAQTRSLRADLLTPINLAHTEDTYFSFLVRENTAPLSAAQLASANRKLSLQFLDESNASHFEFVLGGTQQQFSILSQLDTAGDDVTITGFAPDITYLVVGKLSGNGVAANTMQASFFPSGALVPDFAAADFPWMLTAHGSAGYDPLLTQLQFASLVDGNFTISNIWISTTAVPEPATTALLLLALLGLNHRRK